MTQHLLNYKETAELLGRFGIDLAPAALVSKVEDSLPAAEKLGYPVALKAISPEQTHKTDAGLVHLNLKDENAVSAAAHALWSESERFKLEGLLIQKMAPGGVETLVGVINDPQFGVVVVFGAGGVLVELLDDVNMALPVLSPWQAEQLMMETKIYRLLEGYRGSPSCDQKALIGLLVRVSRLAKALAGSLISLDLNPVFVLPEGQGLFVVDARVVLREEGI